MIYICIPALDEAQTVGVLLWRIRQVMAEFRRDYHLIVVDDGSQDATAQVLEPYARVLPLSVIRHERTRGYPAALETLVRETVARSTHPKRDVAVFLQADFTEPPEEIPSLVKRMEGGADVVGSSIATVDGEVTRGMRWSRRGLPWLLKRAALPREISDPFSGFRGYRVQVLKRALGDAEGRPFLTRAGWAANAELLLRVSPHARRAEDAEVQLRYTRRERASRFQPWDALREAWALARTAPRGRLTLSAPAIPAPASAPSAPSPAPRAASPEEAREERPRRERPRRSGSDEAPRPRRSESDEAPRPRRSESSDEAPRSRRSESADETSRSRQGESADETRSRRSESADETRQARRSESTEDAPRPPRQRKPRKPVEAPDAESPVEEPVIEAAAAVAEEGGDEGSAPVARRKRKPRRRKSRGASAEGAVPLEAAETTESSEAGESAEAGEFGGGDGMEGAATAEASEGAPARRRRPRRPRRRRPAGTRTENESDAGALAPEPESEE